MRLAQLNSPRIASSRSAAASADRKRKRPCAYSAEASSIPSANSSSLLPLRVQCSKNAEARLFLKTSALLPSACRCLSQAATSSFLLISSAGLSTVGRRARKPLASDVGAANATRLRCTCSNAEPSVSGGLLRSFCIFLFSGASSKEQRAEWPATLCEQQLVLCLVRCARRVAVVRVADPRYARVGIACRNATLRKVDRAHDFDSR